MYNSYEEPLEDMFDYNIYEYADTIAYEKSLTSSDEIHINAYYLMYTLDNINIISFIHKLCKDWICLIICQKGELKAMVKLRILEILEEQGHTKYWLYKQMDLSYQNFNRMVKNETRSIRFENLDTLSRILNCPVGELFEQTDNDSIE